jgi:carboxylesterase type B
MRLIPTADGSLLYAGIQVSGNATLANIMRSYFISFTLDQDPNHTSSGTAVAPYWPGYHSENPEVLYVGRSEIQTWQDTEASVQCQFLQLGREKGSEAWPQW